MIRMVSKQKSNLQVRLVRSIANLGLCEISARCSPLENLFWIYFLFDYLSSIRVLIFEIVTLLDFSNELFNYFIMVKLKFYE